MTVSDCYRSDYIFISLTITSISVITLRPEVPDSISVVLCIALFIKLGVKNLLSAHSTNSFGISTGVTVLAILMYLLLANHALGISIRTPSARNRTPNKLKQNHTTRITNAKSHCYCETPLVSTNYHV